jgi:hypothetical protein
MQKKIIGALSVMVICGIGLVAYLHSIQSSDTVEVRVIKLHNMAGQRMIIYQIDKPDGRTDTVCDVEPFGTPDEFRLWTEGGQQKVFLNRKDDRTVPDHKRVTEKMTQEFDALSEAVSRIIDIEALPWVDPRNDTPDEVLRKSSHAFIPLTDYTYESIEP